MEVKYEWLKKHYACQSAVVWVLDQSNKEEFTLIKEARGEYPDWVLWYLTKRFTPKQNAKLAITSLKFAMNIMEVDNTEWCRGGMELLKEAERLYDGAMFDQLPGLFPAQKDVWEYTEDLLNYRDTEIEDTEVLQVVLATYAYDVIMYFDNVFFYNYSPIGISTKAFSDMGDKRREEYRKKLIDFGLTILKEVVKREGRTSYNG